VIVDQSLLGVKEDGICPRKYKQIPPRQQTNALTGGADILDPGDLFSDTTQTDKETRTHGTHQQPAPGPFL